MSRIELYLTALCFRIETEFIRNIFNLLLGLCRRRSHLFVINKIPSYPAVIKVLLNASYVNIINLKFGFN